MIDAKNVAALFVVALLSACGGGMEVGGGPSPDSMTGMMLDPDGSEGGGEMDDTAGTEIPS